MIYIDADRFLSVHLDDIIFSEIAYDEILVETSYTSDRKKL